MSEPREDGCYCRKCGAPVDPTDEKCPNGHILAEVGRAYVRTLIESLKIRASASWEIRREFIEENPLIRWFLLILDFGFTLFGYFLGGYSGVIIGLFISIISELLTPYAIIKVREITRG